MPRRVFFCFEYENDVTRAWVVRNSWVTQGREAAGFIDGADFEKVRRQGDDAVRRWIDGQLEGTSVTVVLVGEKTCSSKWVTYEIERSIKDGKGLLGIDVSKIEDLYHHTSDRCGEIPKGYSFYFWNRDDGFHNMGDWIERAAKDAAR